MIEEKIHNLLELRRHTELPVDLLVYVDAATDRTADILRPYSDRLHLLVATERRGKSAGMNRLVGMTTADILVFTDANVMMEPDALTRLQPYFADPTVGCVCGHLVYTNSTETSTAAVGAAYWRSEEELKQLDSETGGVIGADGSIFAIRASLHRPVPDDIIDDFYLSLSILCDGHRVVRADDVRATETSAVDSADEYRRKVRIACQAFNVHRLMRRRLRSLHWTLRYKYVSHKLLRWLSPLNASVGTLFFALAMATWLAWPVGLLILVLATTSVDFLVTGPVPAPFQRLRDIALALAGTAVGVLRSLRGERFQTWRPPQSRAIRTTNP